MGGAFGQSRTGKEGEQAGNTSSELLKGRIQVLKT